MMILIQWRRPIAKMPVYIFMQLFLAGEFVSRPTWPSVKYANTLYILFSLWIYTRRCIVLSTITLLSFDCSSSLVLSELQPFLDFANSPSEAVQRSTVHMFILQCSYTIVCEPHEFWLLAWRSTNVSTNKNFTEFTLVLFSRASCTGSVE